VDTPWVESVLETTHDRPSGHGARDLGQRGHIIASADSLRAGIATFWENVGRNMKDAKWVWGEGTAVFRRIGGKWMIVAEHLSAPPA